MIIMIVIVVDLKPIFLYFMNFNLAHADTLARTMNVEHNYTRIDRKCWMLYLSFDRV